MSAAKTMVLARLGFADDGVSVRNFALCHLREATILAFVSSKKTFETRRNGGSRGLKILF
jgi:hypothetical protein